MSDSKIRQHYFLTTSYGKGVSEFDIYKEFILKYITEKEKFEEKISTFKNKLKSNHGISVPGNVLEAIFKSIAKEYPSIKLIGDNIKVDKIPNELIQHHLNFSIEFNNDTRIIVDEFNKYLNENKYPEKVTIDYIQLTLEKLQVSIIEKGNPPHDIEEKEKLFFEWIHKIIGSEENKYSKLFKTLNKLLYSFVLYYYYSSLKIPNSNLKNIKPIIDTNILAFLFGISGEIKKEFALEFIEFLKSNEIKIIISHETIHELGELVSNGTDEQILLFKQENLDLSTQLSLNTLEQVKKMLTEIKIKFEIDQSSISLNKSKFSEWKILKDSLKELKKSKRPNKFYSDFSFDHDINLIYIAKAYGNTSNIYDHKTPIITFDFLFLKWFEKTSMDVFRNKYVPIINLDQFVLFLAFEGMNRDTTNFLPMTWMYMIDKIPFFKQESTNNIFKILSNMDHISSPVENWRSTYLLVKNKINTNTLHDFEAMEPDILIDGIRGLGEDLSIAKTKIDILEKNLSKASAEIQELKSPISKPEIINETKEKEKLNSWEKILYFLGKFLKGLFF